MANFKTHITTSTALGFVYGTGAYFGFGIPISHCFVAGGLCGIAGMLPDLDSRSGIPQREMLSLVSVIIPLLMFRRFERMGLTPETIVFVAAAMYAFIRFVIGGLFKRYAKHRGMWHSIPAACIAGLVTFLVCLSPELGVRFFKAWAVVIGFVSHLVLDEIYSVDWQGKTVRIKKSFGTALKLYGKSTWGNISTYGKLFILLFFIAGDGSLMEYLGSEPIESPFSVRDWLFHQVGDHSAEVDQETFHAFTDYPATANQDVMGFRK